MIDQPRDLQKAALRGEPSYVWREGQRRRLEIIRAASGDLSAGPVLVNGCGVGTYLHHMREIIPRVFGLDIEFARLLEAKKPKQIVVNGAGEMLPFPDETFSVVLSNEVIEHVADDRAAIAEIVRTLQPGGRLVLFCPNRGYPFETHGVYWRGRYQFGNIPLVNYLPRPWRNRLAPHVRVYSKRDLEGLFIDLPVKIIQRKIIYGAYDNIIQRFPRLGKFLRGFLQGLERTPLRIFGLSHFWVVEKT